MFTQRFSEQWEVLKKTSALAVAANTETNTGWINCAGYDRIAVIIEPHDVNDALDIDFEQAKDSSGTGVKTLNAGGKDMAVAVDDTDVSIAEIKGEEFDATGRFTHLQIEVTTADTAGGGNDFSVLVLGLVNHRPADLTNVTQVKD